MLTELDFEISTRGGILLRLLLKLKQNNSLYFNLCPFCSLSGALNVNLKKVEHYLKKIHCFALFVF